VFYTTAYIRRSCRPSIYPWDHLYSD